MGYIDGIHVTIAAPWILWVGGVFPLGFTSRNPWGFFLMVKTTVSGEDFPLKPIHCDDMSQKPPGHQALAGQPTDQNSRI